MAQIEEGPPGSEPRAPFAEVRLAFDAHMAVIRLAGEIDLAIGESLAVAAQEAIIRALPVRVDVSEVTFMDSTGLGFLAQLERAGAEAGWRLTVIGPSQLILETLTMCGMVPWIDVQRAESHTGI